MEPQTTSPFSVTTLVRASAETMQFLEALNAAFAALHRSEAELAVQLCEKASGSAAQILGYRGFYGHCLAAAGRHGDALVVFLTEMAIDPGNLRARSEVELLGANILDCICGREPLVTPQAQLQRLVNLELSGAYLPKTLMIRARLLTRMGQRAEAMEMLCKYSDFAPTRYEAMSALVQLAAVLAEEAGSLVASQQWEAALQRLDLVSKSGLAVEKIEVLRQACLAEISRAKSG